MKGPRTSFRFAGELARAIVAGDDALELVRDAEELEYARSVLREREQSSQRLSTS